MDRAAGGGADDRETGEDEEGEVRNAKGSRAAYRGRFQGGWERQGSVLSNESAPGLLPLRRVAVLHKPVIYPWVQYDQAVIKGAGKASSVVSAGTEQVEETGVGRVEAARRRRGPALHR